MKNLCWILIHFSLLCSFVFAKSTPIPTWVTDYKSAFPDSEYIAQRGIGDSAEKAMTDASAALARYFQMTVNANISTTMTEEKTTVIDEVQVKSDVQLFGMQFTEPYCLKKEKKWYAVAYIKRSDAWVQYKPKIDQSSKTFAGHYKKIEEEQDSFSIIPLCQNAWKAGNELLTKLEYGRIIAPGREAAYQPDRDRIAKIPVLEAEAKKNSTIYIELSDDYNNLLIAAISSAFSKAGFSISKNRSTAQYICIALVDNNIAGSDPLAISPSLSINLVNKDERTVYSHECNVEMKTVSYTLENAKKKGYPAFAKEVEKGLFEDLNNNLKQ